MGYLTKSNKNEFELLFFLPLYVAGSNEVKKSHFSAFPDASLTHIGHGVSSPNYFCPK
jgi:hypothetical protein